MQLGTDESKLRRFTQAQIFMDILKRTKASVKPGDKLTVWTIKGVSRQENGKNPKTEMHRKAKVLAVYRNFVHVKLRSPYGRPACEESFLWDDIAKWNKHLWEGVQNE